MKMHVLGPAPSFFCSSSSSAGAGESGCGGESGCEGKSGRGSESGCGPRGHHQCPFHSFWMVEIAGMERKTNSSGRDKLTLLPVKFPTAAPSGCIVTNK